MRHGLLLALSGLLLGSGLLPAQERVPFQVAEPGLPAAPVPVAQPQAPPPAPFPVQPVQYLPPGYIPTPPVTPVVDAPFPPEIVRDPAGNPAFWIGADVLIWWIRNPPLSVPLITTGPASQGDGAGSLGQRGTVSLTPNPSFGAESGLRLYAGGWFDAGHIFGLEGSVFWLDEHNKSFGAVDQSGKGQQVINEPVLGAPFITQVSGPKTGTGGVIVDLNSRFSGADINLLYNVWREERSSVNLVGGFRYYDLEEHLDIAGSSNVFNKVTFSDGDGNILVKAPAGSNVTAFDFFRTHNEFYGGQLGVQFQTLMGRWFFSGKGTLALGDMHQSVSVDGTTIVSPVNGTPVTLSGGNFATLQTGHYWRDHFAVAPELQLNVGYQITPAIRAMVGYDLVYLSSVVRPGNQIDNTYDGNVHPLVPLTTSSFWAQGLNLSLQINY
jgi:hypothetical protein